MKGEKSHRSSVECREVQFGSSQYDETVELRDRVLREPLGLTFSLVDLEKEASDFHLTCYNDENDLLACLILTPETESSVRMRQVAVSSTLQRKGVGTTLVKFSEEFAREKGFTEMTLHAREVVLGFYERMGYKTFGERFEEVTIPHRKMRKDL